MLELGPWGEPICVLRGWNDTRMENWLRICQIDSDVWEGQGCTGLTILLGGPVSPSVGLFVNEFLGVFLFLSMNSFPIC